MPAILTYALLSVPLIGAYAIFALGISVIYRASRVLNLAHGAMAMVPAYLVHTLVERARVPMGIAVLIGVASGAALGVVVERVFVRRLRPQGPTAQTVGTVAVTGLLIAVAAKIWGSTPLLAPRVFPAGAIDIGDSGIRYGDIGLFVTAAVVSLMLFSFFGRTQYGLALRGAAQNRRAAALMGIDPDLAASAAWALGGGLAALGGIMLAAVTNLDPYILSLQVLPAFVAALIGGLESLPGALAGAGIAGLSFGLVPYFSGTPGLGGIVRQSGSPQLVLTILSLVVLATRGRRLSGAGGEAGLAQSGQTFRTLSSRSLARVLGVAAAAILVWPHVVPYSIQGTSINAIRFALIGISLVVLTGWVGQISLGHASFVGIAAFTTGLLVRGAGVGFPLNLLLAGAAAATAATLLGVVALRVRGLYLAVATMIFAWMCDQFLFRSPWMGAGNGSSTIPDQVVGARGGWPSFDLTSQAVLFSVMAAVLLLAVFTLSNLRDTKTGRAFFAVRGSEMAAASLGIDVVRTKLIAFALSGALAGLAGNLFMIEQRTVGAGQFLFTVSLQFLAIAVVGGLGSVGGSIAAGAVFASLDELFLRVAALAGWLEVVQAGLLAVVLLAYPGGLAAAGARIARAVASVRRPTDPNEPAPGEAEDGVAGTPSEAEPGAGSLARRIRRLVRGDGASAPAADWFDAAFADDGPDPEPDPAAASNGRRVIDLAALEARRLPPDRADRRPVLRAESVTVRFGGLTAVADATLEVRDGEIVGLIGPNGAGKTTFFNAILGLNDPAAGRIVMFDRDVTALPPHLRARAGAARTFQVLQLFGELTVFDNLLVATHLHDRSGVWSNLAASGRTLLAEREARERVRRVLALLDLERIADHGVRGLPFGVLRMVELGRALVTGAPLIMLDEPASGLNEAETDRLAEVVTGVRSLGVSVLLIEHDVRMVTGVSDYIYVLAQGRMIAEGTPATVQRHPDVIAAYLGRASSDEAAPEPVGAA